MRVDLEKRDEWAVRYQELGWNPVLLCDPGHKNVSTMHKSYCAKPGKVPLGKWQHLQSKGYDKSEWFYQLLGNPLANVGILLGKVSNLVAIDLDSKEAICWYNSLGVKARNRTPSFVTSRGMRLLYRHNNAYPDLPPSQILAKDAELLANGRQTVMPPSIHASGSIYDWRSFTDEPPLLPDLFYEKVFAKPVLETQKIEGKITSHRNNKLFKMACALRRQGAGLSEIEDCLKILNRLCEPALESFVLQTIAKSVMKYAPSC